MKKFLSLTLALMLALCALAVPTMAEEVVVKEGVLTSLNWTEEELESASNIVVPMLILDAPQDGGESEAEAQPAIKYDEVYYDTLDAMLMALNVGDIDEININYATARYLEATNDNYAIMYRPDELANDTAIEQFIISMLTYNYAFLLMEDHADLRDELNGAIAEMKADGTLDELVQTQIEAAINGEEIAPVEIPSIEGAETIRVAVTGSMPPLDYVAADGTPAGFSTAVMAEISRRLGMNVEFEVVDSVGRATALASGTVDAVFWTITNDIAQKAADMSREERQELSRSFNPTDEEKQYMKQFDAAFDVSTLSSQDKPEGTIVTDPYFSDYTTVVIKNS